MANENLKNALQNAGLTPEEFAAVIRVDPKSVQRWVTGTTTPYPRHRAAISRALGLREHQLWPDETPGPAAESGGLQSNQIGGNEITGAWAYTDEDNAPDPIAITESSDGAIELLHNGTGIELTRTLVDALVAQADAGRQVRLLTCAPTPRLKPLTGEQHVEIRVIEGGVGHSLIRVGDLMLLTFNIAGEGLQPPLLLKLARTVDGGLFDRLTDNLDALWDDAEETITNPQQIDAYLNNTDQDHDEDFNEENEQERTDHSMPGERPEHRSPAATEPAVAPTPSEPEQAPRRWPRRPDGTL